MNDSIIKTIGVAFAICLVCSLIVSSAAVSLRDLQKENKLNDRRIKILKVADIYKPGQPIAQQFKQLESKFIDFNTGKVFDEYQNLQILILIVKIVQKLIILGYKYLPLEVLLTFYRSIYFLFEDPSSLLQMMKQQENKSDILKKLLLKF